MTRKSVALSFLTSAILFLCSCQKEFTFVETTIPGSSSGTALLSFTGEPGTCSNPIIKGLYRVDSALTTRNSVTIQVNVIKPGTYTITSSSVNGITFSTSGTFTLTGPHNINFGATGTPLSEGSFKFKMGLNGCSFLITCTGG